MVMDDTPNGSVLLFALKPIQLSCIDDCLWLEVVGSVLTDWLYKPVLPASSQLYVVARSLH